MSRNRENVESIRKISDISIPSSQMLLGDVSLTNQVITNGFGTTLYTGNGSTQTVTTDVPMSGQWGNDASESYGGLVWGKGRSVAFSHQLYDTVRGATKTLWSDLTNAEAPQATGLTAFNNNGFNTSTIPGLNQNLATYASWNFGTTHIRTGTTNHGKAYTEHCNPFTGFTIIKYEGSGTIGHEIPHSLGRKLGFVTVKNLSVVTDWQAYTETGAMFLNLTNANTVSNLAHTFTDKYFVNNNGGSGNNASTNQYILYGWANSYYDEGQLQGNYEVGTYTGTGVTGNKVTTRGKPAWVMIKRLDAVGNWNIVDVMRSNFDYYLQPNTSIAEYTLSNIMASLSIDGFTVDTIASDFNTLGGQYLYIVAYDNDSGSGKSKYYRTTTTSNLSIANRVMQFSKGVIDGSFKNSSEVAVSETPVPTNGYVDGYNYLYKVEGGSWYSTVNEPTFGGHKATAASHHFVDGNWYKVNELVTNGTFDTDVSGWTGIGTIIGMSSGTLYFGTGAVAGNYAYQDIATVVGKEYTVLGSIYLGTNTGARIYATKVADDSTIAQTSSNLTGNYTFNFIAVQTTTRIRCILQGNGSASFDNISAFAIEPALSSVITPTITYLPKKVLVASGDIVTVDDFKYPSLVQKYVKADIVEGGNLFGVGQTWQDVTGSRAVGTTYTNSTGKPIMVSTVGTVLALYTTGSLIVNGLTLDTYQAFVANANGTVCGIIPNGATYSTTGFVAMSSWKELR